MNSRRHYLTLLAALPLCASALANPQTSAQKELSMPPANAILAPINPMGAAIPGISSAMVVNSGRLMFLSGHVPIDENGKVLGASLEAQLDQVFKNLNVTLQAAGTTPGHLVRITIYVRDFQANQLPAIRRARDRFIDLSQPPASALIGVAQLFHPDVLVEVDAVAVLPPNT